jgi:hypothetical protein
MSASALLFVPLVLLALGVFLIVRGLRGRRVDDHPICRHCGFDLIGRAQGSDRCPECGADLNVPHAMREGRRVRRTGALASGAFLTALVLVFAGVGAWMALSDTNFRQYAPAWYLRREANGNDLKSRDAALAELDKRLVAGVLPQPQIDALADDALRLQADTSRPWTTAWGDLFEDAWAANKISPDRLGRYFDNALASAITLDLRSDITRGVDRLYYWTRSGKARVGSRSTFNANREIDSIDIGPEPRPALHKRGDSSSSGEMLSANGGGGTGTAIYFKPGEQDKIPDGPNPLVMHLDVAIARSWNSPPIYKTKLDLRGTFTMHPAGEATVKINRDPSLRSAIEKAITCRELSYGQWSAGQLNTTIMVGAIPSGVGYDVYAKIHGKEEKLGSFARPAKNGPHVSGGFGFGNGVPPFDDPAIDLILKPSVDAAIGTNDTFEIWDGQIVLKNVPVKRPPSKTPASTATRPSAATNATTR